MARLHKYTAMGADVWCNLPLPDSFPWKEHGSRASQAYAEGEQPRGSFSQAVAACEAPSLLVTAASSVTRAQGSQPPLQCPSGAVRSWGSRRLCGTIQRGQSRAKGRLRVRRVKGELGEGPRGVVWRYRPGRGGCGRCLGGWRREGAGGRLGVFAAPAPPPIPALPDKLTQDSSRTDLEPPQRAPSTEAALGLYGRSSAHARGALHGRRLYGSAGRKVEGGRFPVGREAPHEVLRGFLPSVLLWACGTWEGTEELHHLWRAP
ncbi:unnamed protein product [Lepidochelys kempii]